MKIKLIGLVIFYWGVCLATWADTNQLSTSNNSDASMSKSCHCLSQNDELTQPILSDVALLIWVNEAAVSAYTYNFVNQKTELQKLSSFFTEQGYDLFLKALKESGNDETVQSKKLIVSAIPTRTPIILQKGLLNGIYSWRVQVPLLVSYQNASEFTQQNYVVTMFIVRVPTQKSPRGIAIAQFVVQSKK